MDALDAVVDFLMHPDVEGWRSDVFRDTLGFLTCGMGHKVTPADDLRLGDLPGTKRLMEMARHDAAKALAAAQAQAAEAKIVDAHFITVLASVNFQLGGGWRTKFPKTWALILAGHYEAAAIEVAISEWHKQTPKRVAQFQQALRGLIPPKVETRA